MTPATAGRSKIARVAPPSFPETGRPEALAPGKSLSLHPNASWAACPDRALPRHALLRAAAARCRRGERAEAAGDGRAGGERWQRRGENSVWISYPFCWTMALIRRDNVVVALL
jgi:hypothetical protein